MVERVNGTIKNATVKAGIDSGFILINLKIKHPSSMINGNKQILLLTR
jgi:hypothetical protein